MPTLGKNISDVSNDGYGAYQVRICRNHTTYSKVFPFGEHGNTKKAMAAAQNWRDAMLNDLGERARFNVEPYKKHHGKQNHTIAL